MPARSVSPTNAPCAVCQATRAHRAATSTDSTPSPTRCPSVSSADSVTRPPGAVNPAGRANDPRSQASLPQARTRLSSVTRSGTITKCRAVWPTRSFTRTATAPQPGQRHSVSGAVTTCSTAEPSASNSNTSATNPGNPSTAATARPAVASNNDAPVLLAITDLRQVVIFPDGRVRPFHDPRPVTLRHNNRSRMVSYQTRSLGKYGEPITVVEHLGVRSPAPSGHQGVRLPGTSPG